LGIVALRADSRVENQWDNFKTSSPRQTLVGIMKNKLDGIVQVENDLRGARERG